MCVWSTMQLGSVLWRRTTIQSTRGTILLQPQATPSHAKPGTPKPGDAKPNWRDGLRQKLLTRRESDFALLRVFDLWFQLHRTLYCSFWPENQKRSMLPFRRISPTVYFAPNRLLMVRLYARHTRLSLGRWRPKLERLIFIRIPLRPPNFLVGGLLQSEAFGIINRANQC